MHAFARPDLKDLESSELKQMLAEGPEVMRHVVVEADAAHNLGLAERYGERELKAGVMTAVPFGRVLELLESGDARLV